MEQKSRRYKRLLPAFLVCAAAGLLVCSACTANRKAGTPTPAATVTPPAASRLISAPTPAPPSSAQRATLGPGDHLFVRSGLLDNAPPSLALLNAASGARERNLLPGAAAPDWSVLYAVDIQNGATTLLARSPGAAPGKPPLRQRLIQGEYQLPGMGLDSSALGLSPNGKWLALAGRPAEQTAGGFQRSSGASNHFIVADTAFTGTVRGVMLNGQYRFYALSNDGNALYLLENAAQAQGRFRSQIRLYDLQHGHLAEQPLLDQKGSPAIVSGRQSSVASPDGVWLYSLDSNGLGQSVYALNLNTHALAIVDLPEGGGPGSRLLTRASLLAAADGKTLYVVNGGGSIVRIDTDSLTVRASQAVRLPGVPAAPQSPVPTPGVSAGSRGGFRQLGLRSSVIAPDGQTLFVTGNSGVAAINTADLGPRGYYLAGTPVESLAFSPDGARLYALSVEQAKIIRLDPQSGKVLGEIKNIGPVSALLHVVTGR